MIYDWVRASTGADVRDQSAIRILSASDTAPPSSIPLNSALPVIGHPTACCDHLRMVSFSGKVVQAHVYSN